MAFEFAALGFFHFVFTAWGVGGATVSALLMAKARKEPALMPAMMKAAEAISKLIWIALIGLTATGIAIASLGAGKGNFDAATLTAKHIAVVILVIVGLNITFRILPKLKNLAPKSIEAKPSLDFLKANNALKANSIIALILWYVIVALSAML